MSKSNPMSINDTVSNAQNLSKMGFTIYPDMTSNAIDYYNTALFNASHNFDVNVVLDNAAMFDRFSDQGINDATIGDINNLASLAIAATFTPVRFGGDDTVANTIQGWRFFIVSSLT